MGEASFGVPDVVSAAGRLFDHVPTDKCRAPQFSDRWLDERVSAQGNARVNGVMQVRHSTPNRHAEELSSRRSARALAEQAFSRAAGAQLVAGNRVCLLIDAAQNYPAWLAAIASARHHIHFESYIIHEDSAGLEFANALIAKAQDGVRVRLIYDRMGGFGKASRAFWNRLRTGGVEVRCYNPPHFDSPLGWLSRDHRKMLAVDGEVGFISGLCVGRMWVGKPEKSIEPWRDTGVEVRGPAVADIERAFAEVWEVMGDPIPDGEVTGMTEHSLAGGVSMRIVATVPATGGLFRLDQLVAAMARERLWLTDAYYAGTTPYVQALRAAARDGVDVSCWYRMQQTFRCCGHFRVQAIARCSKLECAYSSGMGPWFTPRRRSQTDIGRASAPQT